jgi:hypothetical protein
LANYEEKKHVEQASSLRFLVMGGDHPHAIHSTDVIFLSGLPPKIKELSTHSLPNHHLGISFKNCENNKGK